MAAATRNLLYYSSYAAGDTTGPLGTRQDLTTNTVFVLPGGRAGLTPEGGFVIKMTNKTSALSVKGDCVQASTGVDNAFILCPTDSQTPCGIVYEDGIPDGSECWVVVQGRALCNADAVSTPTRGYWVGVTSAATAGKCDVRTEPGSTSQHDREIGHCMQNAAQGAQFYAFVGHWR